MKLLGSMLGILQKLGFAEESPIDMTLEEHNGNDVPVIFDIIEKEVLDPRDIDTKKVEEYNLEEMKEKYFDDYTDSMRLDKITDPTTREVIIDWRCINIEDTNIRLYYRTVDPEEDVRKKRARFYFVCIEGSVLNADTADLEYAQIILSGIAYDCIRHLYIGDEQTDNYGYLHYPPIKGIMSRHGDGGGKE